MIDHGKDGKACVLIQVKIDRNVKGKDAITNTNSKLSNLSDMHTVLGVQTVFKSCEDFRLCHAWDDKITFLKTRVEKKEEHLKKVRSNNCTKASCDMWKLGQIQTSREFQSYWMTLILFQNG